MLTYGDFDCFCCNGGLRRVRTSCMITMHLVITFNLFCSHILRMYFRNLGPSHGLSQSLVHYQNLGIAFFYLLFDNIGDESPDCPMLRHLLSCSLEKLGQSMIADHGEQCLPLLERICSKPALANFLTPIFTPNCFEPESTFLHMYRLISEIPEAHTTLAFTLLSKVVHSTN
jgi:hypothetical protein